MKRDVKINIQDWVGENKWRKFFFYVST